MDNKRLPPGFRFHPTDDELVRYYLKRRVLGKKLHFEVIAELDIYKYAPWDLPDRSLMKTGDLKWYFFCPREKKYSSGSRTNRATNFGYWKTTGKDRPVHCKNEIVGMKKTLVFHRGKAPKGDRTDWVMYEYRLEEKELLDRGVAQDAYVLCSIFKKDGPGPRNGAQYGVPFNEEDWDDDDDGGDGVEVVNGVEAVSCAYMSPPAITNNQNQSIVTCIPEALPSVSNSVVVIADDHATSSEPLQDSIENDEMFAMLANFREDNSSALSPNDVNEQVGAINHSEMANDHNPVGNHDPPPCLDGFDIYKDLGDFCKLTGYNEPQDSISACHDFDYSIEEMFVAGNGQFLELIDLDVPLNYCNEAGGYGIVQSDLHRIAHHSNFLSRSSEFRMEDSSVENGSRSYFDIQASRLPSTSATFCRTSETGSGQTSDPIRREGDTGDFLFVMK